MDISSSTDKYESWLAAELGSEILKKDLKKKRKEMVAGPFPSCVPPIGAGRR